MHVRLGAAKVRHKKIFAEDVFANIFILHSKVRLRKFKIRGIAVRYVVEPEMKAKCRRCNVSVL